ncbi:hypothetical protein MCELHM10_01591 [Paracoccaceae bacterium]
MESFYEAVTDYWYGSTPPRRKHSGWQFFGRAQGCDIGQRRIAKESLTSDWALDLEGPLFGQILNGGFIQFVDNCPFVLDETALMLSVFGPRTAFEQFWEMVGPLAVQVQSLRQRLIASDGKVDDIFWMKVDTLIDQFYRDPVDPGVEEEWTRSYIGDDNLFGSNRRFGEVDPSEPWATTIARNILKHAIANAHELGVQLTYDGYDA